MNPVDDRTDVMTAVTFAEAGEWETARSYAPPPRELRAWAWIERHLVAAALAEGGLERDALGLLGAEERRRGGPEGDALDALDALLRAHGLRMSCGVLSPVALGARR